MEQHNEWLLKMEDEIELLRELSQSKFKPLIDKLLSERKLKLADELGSMRERGAELDYKLAQIKHIKDIEVIFSNVEQSYKFLVQARNKTKQEGK